MTDLKKMKAMFDSFGMGYSEEKREEISVLTIEAKVHAKVMGYSGFATEFHFDEKGVFKEASVWE